MRVVITGATAGIGLSCAEKLSHDGHTVIGIARGRDTLNRLESELAGFTGLACDIADAVSLEALPGKLTEVLGDAGVDALVNNAGYGAAGPVELVPLAEWKAQFELNVFGTIGVTQAVLPHLRKANRARIVNISSIVSKIYAPFFSPYYSSKHALENITDSLRIELEPEGISVITVRPGAVKTGFANSEDAMLEEIAENSKLYRRRIARIIAWHEKIATAGVDADAVRDVILTALTAQRPRTRYTVPAFPANFVVPMLQVLPARAGDWMVRRITGLA